MRGYLGLYGQDVTPEIAQSLGLQRAAGDHCRPGGEGLSGRRGGIAAGRRDPGDERPTHREPMIPSATRSPRCGPAPRSSFWSGATARRSEQHRHPGGTARGTGPGQQPRRRRSSRPLKRPKQALGVEVQNLTRSLAQRFGYQPGEGVIVTAVTPEGPADTAGIRPGDLIVSVNRSRCRRWIDLPRRSARPQGRTGSPARPAGPDVPIRGDTLRPASDPQ